MIKRKKQPKVRRMFYLFDLVVLVAWALGGVAHAEGPDRLRLMTAMKKFDNTQLVSVAYELDAFRWLRPHHSELSVGLLTRSGDIRPFVSVGPVWRLSRPLSPWHVEVSISPTLLSSPRLGDRTIGGHFHFTSALSIGRRFGGNWRIALRVQHISNAGLHRHNPGFDSIGLSLSNRR